MKSPQISAKKFKEALASYMKSISVSEEIIREIPTSWEKYTDLVLFPGQGLKNPFWLINENGVWEEVCRLLGVERVAIKGRVEADGFRTPRVTLVRGAGGTVSFTDNGVKYSWDVERLMFSRGNARERHRVAALDCRGLTVVDLFAGIGYFTLAYLVHAGAALVHACEWNPLAVHYLRRNLADNNVADRCIIHEGDNRKAGLSGVGDVVSAGLLPDSEGWWGTACSCLAPSGGTLLLHQCVPAPSLPSASAHVLASVSQRLHQIHSSSSWQVSLSTFTVKSYAPRVHHVVFSVDCRPSAPPPSPSCLPEGTASSADEETSAGALGPVS